MLVGPDEETVDVTILVQLQTVSEANEVCSLDCDLRRRDDDSFTACDGHEVPFRHAADADSNGACVHASILSHCSGCLLAVVLHNPSTQS